MMVDSHASSQASDSLRWAASWLRNTGSWLPYFAFCMTMWAVHMGVYAIAGSFRAEFSGADEAAYVVSGIMTREYLAGPMWQGVSPLAFAQTYYSSYPKVAIGHWPPMYFFVQGVWFLLVGVSRDSVLALSSILSAAFASFAVLLCRREGLRWSLAITAGAIVTLLPLHLYSLLEIGSDVITSIAILVATLCCQRWITHRTTRNGAWFATAAAVAVLTKGSAFVLVLVAPLALLLADRRLNWLWSVDTWRVVALGGVLAAPWYMLTRGWAINEIVPGPPRTLGSAVEYAAIQNVRILLLLGGVGLLVLVLFSLRARWYRRAQAVAILPIATWLFLSFVSPHTENRLFLHVLPVAVFASAIAANALLPRFPELLLIGMLFASHTPFRPLAKPAVGFIPAAAWVQSHLPTGNERMLVTSNGAGEGAFISELALHEPFPTRTVVRASKVLQSSRWMGDGLQLHARTADDVRRILTNNGISHIVRHTSRSTPPAAYEDALGEALREWHLISTFDEVAIYERLPAK